jgi:uncharacterized protein
MNFMFHATLFGLMIAAQAAVAELASTGTGFAVTFDGIVVTSNHVIDECDAISTRLVEEQTRFEAKIVASDPVSDIAAIKFDRRIGQRVLPVVRATFRKDPSLEQGERAITYGFPLQGALAKEGNLTIGNVTALRGLFDNPNYIQISTPVQPGNSGGPLLDGSGHVIGVVAEKLNAIAVMRATGDVPQNVNFAVSLAKLKQFLAIRNIIIAEELSETERQNTEIVRRARLFTYLVECFKSTKQPMDRR